MLYELVIDNGETEIRKDFNNIQAAKDAWAVTMLNRNNITSATLYYYDDDGDSTIEQRYENDSRWWRK